MRISIVKIIGVTLAVTWAVLMVTVLRVGSFLPVYRPPPVNKEKGSYYENLYYATLYDDDNARPPDEVAGDDPTDLSNSRALNKIDAIAHDTEKKLEKDFLEVVTNYLENVNYYRGELKQSNPLHRLGFYEEFDKSYLNFYHNGKDKYQTAHLGLLNEPSYCEVADFYNLHHSENIFGKPYIFTDYKNGGFVRKYIIESYGVDAMPNIEFGMPKSEFLKKRHFLDKRITMLFTKKDNFHYYHELGKNFLGFTQMYNHIPGSGVLRRFDTFTKYARAYNKSFENSPQCFNYTDLFIKSYRLSVKSECSEFFALINDASRSEAALDNIWLNKNYNAHSNTYRRERVSLSARYDLNEQFESGTKCGEVKAQNLIAQNIGNNILRNGSSVLTLRAYVLISSTNPLEVYMQEGYFMSFQEEDFFNGEQVKQSDSDSQKLNSSEHIKRGDIVVDLDDNIHDQIIKGSAPNNSASHNDGYGNADSGARGESNEDSSDDSEDPDGVVTSSPDHLKIRMQEVLNDTTQGNNIRNGMLEHMKTAVIHAIQIGQPHLYPSSGVFELYAADFIVDEDLHPRLLNFESSPTFKPGQFNTFFKTMLHAVFDIEYSYLKSRVIRVHRFMSEYHKAVISGKKKPMDQYKLEFKDLNRNILDSIVQLQTKSNFKKILSLHPDSTLTFSAYLTPKCLALTNSTSI